MSSPPEHGSAIRPPDAAESAERTASRTPRSWNDVLPILSHALRTPLNGILGMSKLLVQGQLQADARRHAEIIHSSTERLLRLVDALLDLSKIESGQLELEAEDFRLPEVVRDTVELRKPSAKSKRIDLRFTVADGVPEGVRGDIERLRLVLHHLIGNAVKFTRRGFVFVTVTREEAPDSADERPWIRFSVRDTGIGVDPELQARIFEPFVQGDSSDTWSYGGNGLGLALCQGLVDAMGGQIDVESTLGEGSTFTFTVPFDPVARPEELAASAGSSAERPTPDRSRRKSFRILVAEDDEVNRLLALRVLAEAGYQADAVHNGLKALEALEERSYDLILMDCQMPELDGYEATRLLRQLEKGQRDTGYRRLPVVAVTALTMPGDRERCAEAGMDDFVAKPYRAADLTRIVDRHLGFHADAVQDAGVPRDDTSPKVLDEEVFRQLRDLTGPVREGFLSTLLDTFVRERTERCGQLEEALSARQERRLAKLSHKLISAAGSVGAYRLAKLAGDLEIQARAGKLDDCRSILDRLIVEYDNAESALRDVLASAT